MQKIQVLDYQTINKIAAGEVVESPKSVVKELVENAIDANASSITVEIKEGGISYIRVTDNGCGIAREQVKTAFLRHATSKILHIEDLDKILSLGFRGEALASIAGVAQVEMTTKTKEEINGTYLEINGGKVIKFQSAACIEGTSLVIKNLFYNVPARRKFLKKPSTEASRIAELLNQFALGHPDITFKYINNNTTILHTTGNNDKKAAVLYVYGKDVASKMLEINFQKGDFHITGLLGKPELSRANRSYENLFINHRYIKNAVISSAIEEAYKTRLLIGKFPVYVLHFTIPPTFVDVNVHPAKLEVRFQNEDEIYALFYAAVNQCFHKEVLVPKADWKPSKETKEEIKKEIKEETTDIVIESNQRNVSEESEKAESFVEKQKLKKEKFSNEKLQKETTELKKEVQKLLELQESKIEYEVEPQISNEIKSRDAFFKNYKIIGQIFNTYWLVEQNKSIFMIDQHAAHERVLYEELMEGLKKQKVTAQMLLQPLLLKLTEKEKQVLQDNMELLYQFGFSIEGLEQKNSYALLSVPFIIKAPTSTKFFLDILDKLEETPIETIYDTKIMMIATMACKAAVKGNDRLDIREATALIEKLLQLENPFTCPHGRPTIIEMTQYELEKQFKRK